MNQRLLQFLSAENISQAQFADTIGVARASVSHILAGRNKPGFDFIESMSSHFPDLSLEWLINGKGKMYKSMPSPVSRQIEPDKAEIKPVEADESPAPVSVPPARPVLRQEPSDMPAVSPVAAKVMPEDPASQKSSARHNISRIIVFYDDNTYQELK